MELEVLPHERAARTERFSSGPAPPPPQRKFAHRDFDREKMVISEASGRLRTLLLRKISAGETISDAQRAAATTHGIDIAELQREARHASPASLVPALYVEAGLVPKAKRRPSLKAKAATGASRKSARLSLTSAVASSVLAASGSGAAVVEQSGDDTPLLATCTGTPAVVASGAQPGGPTERSSLKQARAALARIVRLEAALAAGETLPPGQLARLASKHLWEELAARLQAAEEGGQG
jgi:hypothetical protein